MSDVVLGRAFGARRDGWGLLLSFIVLATTSATQAAIYTFQNGDANGYTGTAGTYILLNTAGGSGDTNYGTSGSLITENQVITSGNSSEGSCSTLIRFDNFIGSGVGQVASGTPWVYRAYVTLRTSSGTWAGSGNTNAIYQVLKPWDENQATYNDRLVGVPWETAGLAPGDDHAVTPADTLIPNVINNDYDFDVTSSTRDFLTEASSNYGWIVRNIDTPEGTDQATFYSDDYSTVDYRPTLTIETMPDAIGGAQRSVFQQGSSPNGATDATYIFERWDGAAGQDTNYGADATLAVEQQTTSGTDTEGIRQALVRFPDAIGSGEGQVPLGSVVVSARLALLCTDGSTGSVYVNRVLQNWDEMQATYNDRLAGTPWGTPGMQADVDYQNIAHMQGHTASTGSFNELDVTAIAQAWADGAPNHGVVIRSNSNDGITYSSDDAAVQSNRPVLIIDTARPGWGVSVRSATASNTAATYIEQNALNTNYGAGTRLYAETDSAAGQLVARSLISFPDLIGDGENMVPVDADILSATLRMHISNDVNLYSNSNGEHSLYQVLTPWSEDTVTWANFNNGGTAGIDYMAAALDSVVPVANDGFYYFDVTEAVQNWADGQANYGWMLINPSTDQARWDSDDYSVGVYRPLLVVHWVPEPSTFGLACLGLLWLLRGRYSKRHVS